ncbi:venom allergen 2-like [Solenopsis invicta]|uniref:venom allergen 2-like n=1 Tax=Solenopsis invicta TaxID=13686 RepID=UPI000E340452|nr:venom allergen 2-like [Solenopsis invicta]
MKAFVLATCLLVTMVYAFDLNEVKQFLHPSLLICAKTLPKCGNEPRDILIRPDVWYCTLSKRGIIQKNGAIILQKALRYCELVISPDYTDYCKKTVSECIEKGSVNENSGPNNETIKSQAAIECAIKKGLPNFVG